MHLIYFALSLLLAYALWRVARTIAAIIRVARKIRELKGKHEDDDET